MFNEIKNTHCVKCYYHAVISKHICTKNFCPLPAGEFYDENDNIKRIEKWIEGQRRKRLERSMRRLENIDTDEKMSFEEVMLLVN